MCRLIILCLLFTFNSFQLSSQTSTSTHVATLKISKYYQGEFRNSEYFSGIVTVEKDKVTHVELIGLPDKVSYKLYKSEGNLEDVYSNHTGKFEGKTTYAYKYRYLSFEEIYKVQKLVHNTKEVDFILSLVEVADERIEIFINSEDL